MKRALVVAAWLVAIPGTVTAEMARGPYLQRTTPTSVVIAFDLETAATAQVRFGGQMISDTAVSIHHEVTITGLQPDTKYTYSVIANGNESPSRDLWTSVAAGSPFSFVLYGDTRSNTDRHTEVVEAIVADAPHFAVQTGDLVDNGSDGGQWDEFFQIEQPLLSAVPMFPALGNHDSDDDGQLFREAFALPENELYYSFDYGSAHFLILDGWVNVEGSCQIGAQNVDDCFDPVQRAWIEADLIAARTRPEIDFIFVATHEGPYSSRIFRSGSEQMRALLPMFQEHGVTAILSGHDHYYQRGLSGNGIPYIISGGAGAPLYSLGSPSSDPHTVLAQRSAHHYVLIEIAGDTARIRAKTPDGMVFDDATLTVDPGPGDPDDPDDPNDPDPDDPDDPNDPGDPDDPGKSGGCVTAGGAATAWIGLVMVGVAMSIRRRRRR